MEQCTGDVKPDGDGLTFVLRSTNEKRMKRRFPDYMNYAVSLGLTTVVDHACCDWLGAHPERDLITRRYLRHDRRLTRDALARLLEADGSSEDPDEAQQAHDDEEAAIEKPVRLNDQRMVCGARPPTAACAVS